ncbi:MAG: LysR family transcriptional regulator [Gemmatimonadaceae bacterium]|nr:LysR family transcriptional regulator [Gemmatimonadaceae bacterium]
MSFELRHLRYFVAVAEELHFGRAASRLGIAQPPLSQQIQALEKALGVRLLERSRRHVALTPAGAQLLGDARRVLRDVREAATAARRAARGETGTLSVAFAASVMFLALPRIIRRFREQFPGVHLELRELATGPQLAALRSGELDVGFLRQPPPDPMLVTETVMTEPLMIAVSRRHPLATRRRLVLKELATQDFVLFPSDLAPGLHAQVLSLCTAAGFTPGIRQVSRELYTTVSLVEAGMGVTIIPSSVRKMGWRGVRYFPIAGPGATTHIDAARRADNSNPVVRAFLDLVRAAVRTARSESVGAGLP